MFHSFIPSLKYGGLQKRKITWRELNSLQFYIWYYDPNPVKHLSIWGVPLTSTGLIHMFEVKHVFSCSAESVLTSGVQHPAHGSNQSHRATSCCLRVSADSRGKVATLITSVPPRPNFWKHWETRMPDHVDVPGHCSRLGQCQITPTDRPCVATPYCVWGTDWPCMTHLVHRDKVEHHWLVYMFSYHILLKTAGMFPMCLPCLKRQKFLACTFAFW